MERSKRKRNFEGLSGPALRSTYISVPLMSLKPYLDWRG